jgi:hypothetical protein
MIQKVVSAKHQHRPAEALATLLLAFLDANILVITLFSIVLILKFITTHRLGPRQTANMAITALSTWPFVLFGVLEPAAL